MGGAREVRERHTAEARAEERRDGALRVGGAGTCRPRRAGAGSVGWHGPTLPRHDGRVEAEQLWRSLTPQVIGALVRRYGDFGRAEDAVQEALLAASVQWPRDGVPDDPRAWLIRVASRRLIDLWRSDDARARRELAEADTAPSDAHVQAPADAWVEQDRGEVVVDGDDTLTLLLLCCHPALTPASQVALTLRAVARTHDGRDRERLPRAGADDGAADQPRQGRDPSGRRAVPDAGGGAAAPADGGGASRALPRLQRGLHHQSRRPAAPGRPDPRGDPPGPRRPRAAASGR